MTSLSLVGFPIYSKSKYVFGLHLQCQLLLKHVPNKPQLENLETSTNHVQYEQLVQLETNVNQYRPQGTI